MEQRYSSHSIAHTYAPPPPPPPSSSFSKKAYNGNGFTTVYDDVFGGPPKYGPAVFAPRPDDYAEIFGTFRASRASSIPTLDLPPVDDDAVFSFDARSSAFDYSEVFAGSGEVDFAVPYDRLFWQSTDDVSEEGEAAAWSSAGSGSPSEASDPSERNECIQIEAYQSADGRNLNLSYHKVDFGSGVSKQNMVHAAQVDAVPGYTCVVDKPASLVDDTDFREDFSGNLSEQRHMKQTSWNTSHAGIEMQSFGNDRKFSRGHGHTGPPMDPNFVSVSDINLRTEPSHLPPPSRPPPFPADREGFSGNLTLSPRAPKHYGCEMAEDDSSPPFFDIEEDANSSVTDSAASMDEIIENAQARQNTAKELMVKKKDGSRSYSRSGQEIDTNSDGVVVMNGVGIWEVDRCHATRREHNEMKVSKKGSQGGRKAMPVLADLPERTLNLPRKPSQKKHKKKASAMVDPVFAEGTGKWKEAIKYYEFIKNDKCRTETQLPNHAEKVVVYTEACRHWYSDGRHTAPEMQQNSDEGIRTARRTPEQWENAMPSNTVNEAYAPEESRRQPKSVKSAFQQDYDEKMVRMTQDIADQVICDHAETRKSKKTDPQGIMGERSIWTEKDVEKNERGIVKGRQLANNENNYDELCTGREEHEGKLWESLQREEDKKVKEACESDGDGRKFRETRDRELKDREVKEAYKRGENERMKKPWEMGENDSRTKEPCAREDNHEFVQQANKRDAKDSSVGLAPKQRRDKDSSAKKCELEKERALEQGPGRDGMKGCAEFSRSEGCTPKEALEKAWDRRNLVGTDGLECSCKVFKVVAKLEQFKEHGETLEDEENCKRHDDAGKLIGKSKKLQEVYKRAGDSRQFKQSPEHEEVSEKPLHAVELEATEKAHLVVGQEGQNSVCKDDLQFSEYRGEAQDSCSGMEMQFMPSFPESSDVECIPEKKTKLGEVAHKLENPTKEPCEAEEMASQSVFEMRSQHVKAERKFEAIKMVNVLVDERKIESLAHHDAKDETQEHRTGEVSLPVHIDEMIMKHDEGIGSEQILEEKNKVLDPCFTNGINQVIGGRMENVVDASVLFDQEENMGNSGNSKPIQGLAGLSGEVGLMQATRALKSETKESIQKRSPPPEISQNTVRTGNECFENFVEEGRDEQLKREKELDNERIRKLEEKREREEREREMEREKDKMVVEMLTCEAREKATLERATLEARQKAMAEARERLERACAEARERSLAEKASAEARMRAERAAVERATAEARQRAIEKAMADRSTFHARERLERSVSDKFSSSRGMELRQSSSSCTENYYGAGGESAQRYKARLERHRRTAERAAKALAEKNLRDLLAQREQAERNRLAETLDAEIKRWSNGKEGNLRALLSTLQYILGPDSGWQPIPLTDVITAVAVKKAYRKATLYVHPDKLQQRGASVHQKYICEKVFDLLKDAWNKFNSEER
ncbi:hypothetical protein Dimus_017294 [Dionaea muscipula]